MDNPPRYPSTDAGLKHVDIGLAEGRQLADAQLSDFGAEQRIAEAMDEPDGAETGVSESIRITLDQRYGKGRRAMRSNRRSVLGELILGVSTVRHLHLSILPQQDPPGGLHYYEHLILADPMRRLWCCGQDLPGLCLPAAIVLPG